MKSIYCIKVSKIFKLVALVFMFNSYLAHSNSSCQIHSDTVKIEMVTSKGTMKIILYPETSLHKENFIKLINENFYEGILFHRVMNNFMAQAGDPNSKDSLFQGALGQASEGETIPAEFFGKYHHKKGALAAARKPDQMNPKKASSGSQFYIVQGNKFTIDQLKSIEARLNSQKEGEALKLFLQKKGNESHLNFLKRCQKENLRDSMNLLIEQLKPLATKNMELFKFTDQAIVDYSNIGGSPHLDGGYTVFGEVVEGLEIIDEICTTPTNQKDRPEKDVKIISLKFIK